MPKHCLKQIWGSIVKVQNKGLVFKLLLISNSVLKIEPLIVVQGNLKCTRLTLFPHEENCLVLFWPFAFAETQLHPMGQGKRH
jgi:hypothetical protein